jgi:hypothetical protein
MRVQQSVRVLNTLRATGARLPDAISDKTSRRFGRDFTNVQLHTDHEASQSARALNASAYTVGNHIVVDRDFYRPSTPRGRRLLAHELAHVVQQDGVATTPDDLTVSSPDDRSERQADAVALGAEPAGLSGTGVLIQREPRRDDDEDDDDTPRDRSRRARPRNAPRGTVPIDQSGLDRDTIHKIKDAIGADPDTWVGITPDGDIVTTDSDGNIENHGHVSDYARQGSENIPKWVWALLGLAALVALIVLFVTGVGEVALITAGLGWAATAIVLAAVRAAGLDSASAASEAASEGSSSGEDGVSA